MGIAQQRNYRAILRQELERRSKRNPRYSLRSFARDLKLSPARLSDVLRNRYGLSRSAALEIAERLGFGAPESDYFCDLVDSEHARGAKLREAAQRRLAEARGRYNQLSEDHYESIADIHHFALLELVSVEGFRSDPAWIARALGITVPAAEAAVARLLRLGLLKRTDSHTLTPAEAFTATTDGLPSEAVRKSHHQVLEKAAHALDFHSLEERDLSCIIFAADSSRLREAKEAIRAFRRDFDSRFGTGERKNRVMCLAVQLFSLQEKESENATAH